MVYLDGAGSGAAVVDAMAGVDPGVTDTLTEVLVAGNTSGGTNIELSTTDKVQFRRCRDIHQLKRRRSVRHCS